MYMKKRSTFRLVILTLLLPAILHASAEKLERVTFFEFSSPEYTIFNSYFKPLFHIGTLNEQRSAKIHLGMDMILITMNISQNHSYSLGANASSRLFLIPEGAVFHVDNFYATFALFFEGTHTSWFSWRFYPYYHLSAHLSDGYIHNRWAWGSNMTQNIVKDKRTVSNEMFYLSLLFRPFKDFETALSAGYYFHTIHRSNLKGRLDTDIQYIYDNFPMIKPFTTIKHEIIFENGMRHGFEGKLGVIIRNKKQRGVILAFNYTNKVHPGEYSEHYIKGYGFDLGFTF